MRILLLFSLLTIYATSDAQDWSTYEKKGKKGIAYNKENVTKAKYASIELKDDSVATAYKGKKVYFINLEGKIVYKTKKERADVFSQGNAIISKKEKFGAINRSGDIIIPVDRDVKPVKVGPFLSAQTNYTTSKYIASKFDLYGRSGLLQITLDTIFMENGWLIAKDHSTETHKHIKKRRIRKDKITYTYTHTYFQYIYNSKTQEQIGDELNHYETFGEYLQVNEDGEGSLHHIDKGRLVHGAYDRFAVFDQHIFAITDTVHPYDNLHIYDKKGALIRDDLGYIGLLDESRHIFTTDSLQYIGDVSGNRLSPLVTGFGEYGEGQRIVFFGGFYGFMNDSTYEILPNRYRVLARVHSSGGGRRRGPARFIGKVINSVRNVGRRIGNIGRDIIGRPTKPLHRFTYGYSSAYRKDAEIVESGHPFCEGWARVCLYETTADSSKAASIYKSSGLEYNFINKEGELFNNKHYANATDFKNGRAWVFYDGLWRFISADGTEVQGESYREVEHLENGYHIVVRKNLFGVVDENYELVVPCQYKQLKVEGDKIIEQTTENPFVYKFPN